MIPCFVPIYEVFFDKPITVTDDFWVSVTDHNDVLDRQSYSFPGLGAHVYDIASVKLDFPDPTLCNPQRLRIRHYELFTGSTYWYTEEDDLIPLIFPILDSSELSFDTCSTVSGLAVVHQDSAYAFISWQHGEFNRHWQLAYGPADEDPDSYAVLDAESDTCPPAPISPTSPPPTASPRNDWSSNSDSHREQRERVSVEMPSLFYSPKATRAKPMISKRNALSQFIFLWKGDDKSFFLCIFAVMKDEQKSIIEQVWEDRSLLRDKKIQNAIRCVVDQLDKGELRIAEKVDGQWRVNEWLKKAVILYFPINQMDTIEVGPFEFHDKIGLKHHYAEQQVRVVPHAIARHGAFLAPGVVMMPSYVNIGAYVDSGTMVDTWATVGSCAQIGKNVHLSGGVGIGGVLEPVQAAPVIIEDHCFIGSRCIVVEGTLIEEEAVLGANTVITASTHIIDVTGAEPATYKGRVPARSIVIPGTYTKHFPAGDYQVSCALIIGKRSASTDKKTSLNEALREYGVSV